MTTSRKLRIFLLAGTVGFLGLGPQSSLSSQACSTALSPQPRPKSGVRSRRLASPVWRVAPRDGTEQLACTTESQLLA